MYPNPIIAIPKRILRAVVSRFVVFMQKTLGSITVGDTNNVRNPKRQYNCL
jgi:hypothetical protein